MNHWSRFLSGSLALEAGYVFSKYFISKVDVIDGHRTILGAVNPDDRLKVLECWTIESI